jgi:hypothetical protein
MSGAVVGSLCKTGLVLVVMVAEAAKSATGGCVGEALLCPDRISSSGRDVEPASELGTSLPAKELSGV